MPNSTSCSPSPKSSPAAKSASTTTTTTRRARTQKPSSRQQMEIAAGHKQPIIIHCRPSDNATNAWDDTLDVSNRTGRRPGSAASCTASPASGRTPAAPSTSASSSPSPATSPFPRRSPSATCRAGAARPHPHRNRRALSCACPQPRQAQRTRLGRRSGRQSRRGEIHRAGRSRLPYHGKLSPLFRYGGRSTENAG